MATESGSLQLTTEQLLSVAQTAESAGDMDRALGFYRALTEIDPKNPLWPFNAIRLLRNAGREPEAVEALGQALKKWPRAQSRPELAALVPELNPGAEEIRNALGEDCPPDEDLKRALVEDDGKTDLIVTRGGRKSAVIVFTGLADRMVMPLPLFDRYLAELDLSAIYVRDRKRIGYFSGVTSLGGSYDNTLTAFKELLVDMGALTVHTIGNSAGGMAAVSYGLDLKAKTVLGFSAPVALLETTLGVDRRTDLFARRLFEQVPEARRDLRARTLASSGTTQVHLYYGEEMPEDRYHAASLEGVPCVHLHPLQGLGGHGALFRMANKHGLRPLMRELYGAAD